MKNKATIIRKRVPAISRRRNHRVGGVGSYYRSVEKHLSNDIELFDFQANRHNQSFILFIIFLLTSYIRLFISLMRNRSNLYMLNTSLDRMGVFRDGVLALCLRILKKNYIVYFRGWHPDSEKRVENKRKVKLFLDKSLLSANHIIVLSERFKNKIIGWGYKGQVSIETTAVDDELLEDFDPASRNFNTDKSLHAFYIGNIINDKGIYEIVKACKILRQSGIGISFTIAGDGNELQNVKQIAYEEGLDINFPGYTTGESKRRLFQQADFFVFPSYHEGMPNAVLEAMAFGLPVITTRAGGIHDFFEDGEMGYFIEMQSGEDLAEKIRLLVSDRDQMKRISEKNHVYARQNFMASVAARRIEAIIDHVNNNNGSVP